MKLKSQLRSGVILSYINLLLGMIIPLFYTPVMLSMLGQAEYGLYSLAASAVSYLSLLSFGFGSAIVRYIAKYRAENNKPEEERTYGFFIMLYCGLAILVMIVGVLIAFHVEPIFHKGLTEQELFKMKILVLIMTFNSALSFPISVFSSMIIAHERYIFSRIINIILTVSAPITNLIALYLGFASVGMSLATTFTQFLLLPVYIFYCSRSLSLKPRFTKMPRPLIREMLGFSIFIFMGSIVDMLFWATDKVILGMLAGSVAVAVYNVGSTFNNIVIQLSTNISGVLVPKITGMVITNASKEELTDLFIRVGRLQFIIIGLIVSGFTVFGQQFISLWAGENYKDSFWIAVMTMFPLCIPLIQNTGLSIVVAQNKHQFRSIVYLMIAILNVVSTYLVVPILGAKGAALCSCVAYLLGQGLIMNIYYYRVTGLNIPLFWITILKMAIIPTGMLITGIYLKRFHLVSGWTSFFGLVLLYTITYILLMWNFAFNNYEKDIFKAPVRKMFVRMHT